jgi:hypothetical protein
MLLQSGGLKKRRRDKTGLTPVRDMINSPGARLEMLTCGSAKGFMFVLNVSPDHSEYVALANQRFTTPVTSFILKLAITSENEEGIDPGYTDINKPKDHKDYMINKGTETETGFFEEAKLQQDIWKTSVMGGREETCPSIANLSFFKNADALKFLNFMRYKVHEVSSIHTVNYLYNVCNNNGAYGLGLILMPKVERSETFHVFKSLPQHSSFYGLQLTDEDVYDMYANLIAKIIKLYIESEVIHFDLHGNNALVYLANDGRLKMSVIDFGKASDLKSDVRDKYFSFSEKQGMIDDASVSTSSRVTRSSAAAASATSASKASAASASAAGLTSKGYLKMCLSMCETASQDDKTEFVRDIISKIREKDHEKNQELYGNPTDYKYGSYQMDWVEALLPNYTQMLTRGNHQYADDVFSYVAPNAFDTLCELLTSSLGHESSVSIEFLHENCENFEGKTADHFVVPFKTTWTEWGKSFKPYVARLFTNTKKGGRRTKRRINKTCKHKKIKKNKNLKISKIKIK